MAHHLDSVAGRCFDSRVQQETDIQLVGRIYRDTIAATKRDNPAYHACLAAWRERYPDAEDRRGKEIVARLICRACEDGLVWGDIRWWTKHGQR
jgi:hypothetical protein